jgi:hypothetical protein
MATVWTAVCATLVVVACGAVLVAPSRVRAISLGTLVHRLRGDIYDATLTGTLPNAEPVRDLLAAVEHVAEHHRRLRLVDLVAYDLIDRYVHWRRGPVVAAPLPGVQLVPVLAVIGAPVRLWAGLDDDETARLDLYRARLDRLTAPLLFTTSWSGLIVVAWFMATGLRAPRAAVAAANRSRIGRAARRGVMQIRPRGTPPWIT